MEVYEYTKLKFGSCTLCSISHSYISLAHFLLVLPHADNSEEAAVYHELKSQCKSIAQDFEIMTRISSLVSRLSSDFMVIDGKKGWLEGGMEEWREGGKEEEGG